MFFFVWKITSCILYGTERFLYISQMEGGECMQTSILWEGSLPSKEEIEHMKREGYQFRYSRRWMEDLPEIA